jgi:hypothetical protein
LREKREFRGKKKKLYFIGCWDFLAYATKCAGKGVSFIYSGNGSLVPQVHGGRNLTLFFIFTKITIHMAMRINVTTTPTRTPSTGVICTRTARDDAENTKNVIFVVDL